MTDMVAIKIGIGIVWIWIQSKSAMHRTAKSKGLFVWVGNLKKKRNKKEKPGLAERCLLRHHRNEWILFDGAAD